MHPCLSCGACCAYFRVVFYWRETLASHEQHNVPEKLSTDTGPWTKAMLGTTDKKPKCQALAGEIGKNAACKIYDKRPSPCRDFQASFENGTQNPRCDEARAKHGLRPLKPKDFKFEVSADREPETPSALRDL